MHEALMSIEVRESGARLAATLTDDADLFAQAAERIRAFAPTRLVTVARGSSDHAAEYAGRLAARSLGLLPSSLPPSLVTLARAPIRWEGALVLAISQSGASPDIVAPVEAARAGGALTISLVNAPGSPLAAVSDIALPVAAGEERAVAATKSVILSMAQSARLIAALADDAGLARALAALPGALDRAVAVDWSDALPLLEAAHAPYVVGRGLGFATAREAALKLKEICRLQAEAVSGAEIMHGPKATITPGDPVLAFAGEAEARGAMRESIAALAAIGARVIIAGGAATDGTVSLPAPSGDDPRLDALLKAAAFFPFCARLAAARGLDPDRPRNLQKVTQTV